MIREIRYYANMTRGFYRLLRSPFNNNIDILREQLAQRESRFLEIARRTVFANPANPYHAMFRLAGCEWGDLAGSVKSRGLEPTLEQLASEGVYLSHDELKGTTPLVRVGRHISFSPDVLLNTSGRGGIDAISSGSRSRGTPTRKNIEAQLYRAVYDGLRTREFSLDTRACGLLQPILPSSSALHNSVERARAGGKIDRWFTVPGDLRDAGYYRGLTHFLVGFGRSLGADLPWPTYLPLNDFLPVAKWIVERRREGQLCALRCFASPAVRVVAAARQAGLDISGTIFFVGGEALTESKRSSIEQAGCEAYPHYAISEVGAVGMACRRMKSGNSVHIYRDALAVVSRMRQAPLSGAEVSSLLFTSLLPCASRFLINGEMDDSGVIEPTTCECEYAAAGLCMQVRDIFSYGKLTGQGITLFGSDVVRILETTLPERFGGAPGDYQLVEREGGQQTELVLRVSPRTGARSTTDVHAFFLSELRKCYGGSLAARLWKHSEGLAVRFEEPHATLGGKVLPLHVLDSEQGRSAYAS